MNTKRALPVLWLSLSMGISTAQEPVLRRAEPEEREAIQRAMDALIAAVNNRDLIAFQALAHERFYLWGEGWDFIRSGYGRFRTRVAEPGAQVAAVTRAVRMIGNGAATIDGFFRTSGLKSDYAGDFSAEFVKQQGKWVVHLIRCTPYFFEAPHSYRIEASAEHGKPDTEGWITLFDGKSLDAFTSVDGGEISSVWSIEETDLRLKAVPPGQRVPGGVRSIRTRDTFSSFEMEFDWRLGPKGNSGVKYGLMYLTTNDGAGLEYQLADDDGDPGAINDAKQRSGALYQQYAPRLQAVAPQGEYNRSRIVVRGRRCEHWLNGQKVIDVELPFRSPESPLLLQNHSTDAWFRSMRIRRLSD